MKIGNTMGGRITGCLLAVVLAMGLCPGLAQARQASGLAGTSTEALSTQATAVDEVEPNDDFDSATTIPMNAYVYGTGDGYDDDYDDVFDFYQFNLPQSGTVKMTFVNGKYAASGSFDYSLYDSYYDNVDYDSGFARCSSTRPVAESWNLKQGVNRLRIWAPEGHPYHFKLSYVIPTTAIKKVTKASRAFTIKWAKKIDAVKYQLRYATKKNMSDAKLLDVGSATSSKTITGLKSKQKYFAQVRVVKVIGGETYYSPWSSKKSVKTK